MIAVTAINETSRPYSTIEAPSSSRTNRFTCTKTFFISFTPQKKLVKNKRTSPAAHTTPAGLRCAPKTESARQNGIHTHGARYAHGVPLAPHVGKSLSGAPDGRGRAGEMDLVPVRNIGQFV
jgi:hypothetical protein